MLVQDMVDRHRVWGDRAAWIDEVRAAIVAHAPKTVGGLLDILPADLTTS